MQALTNAGHSTVFVLHADPMPDQPLVAAGSSSEPDQAAQEGGSIAVRGADGGLDFGLDGRSLQRQTVFDATFYRPVNTIFTGDQALGSLCLDLDSLVHAQFPSKWCCMFSPLPRPTFLHILGISARDLRKLP